MVARRRRPSTPPPPPVPLEHPTLDTSTDPVDPTGTGAGDYPLLTLPEQRQSRHSISTRASLQIERGAGHEQRISLPRTVRHSYDEKRLSVTPSPIEGIVEAGPSETRPQRDAPRNHRAGESAGSAQSATRHPELPVGLILDNSRTSSDRPRKLDKGKGKAIMASPENGDKERGFSQDLERGPDVLNVRHSTASRISGIGSAVSSSDSSIMGDPDQQPDFGEGWGPQHPCFPHLNPHVPIDSPEYTSTRIIRVRRDWLIQGDLAPTFSNLYPEILDPAGLSEQEFRRIIEKLNGELVPIFSPYSWRNLLDGVLGLATGWIWDDFGLTGAKSRLRNLEKWIEKWNLDMEKTANGEEGAIPPKIIPLRRTGYMTVSFMPVVTDIFLSPPPTY